MKRNMLLTCFTVFVHCIEAIVDIITAYHQSTDTGHKLLFCGE